MGKLASASAVVTLSLAGAAPADVLYGFDILDQSIFTIDTDSGSLKKYYGHAVSDYGGLDFDSAGNLYLEQAGSLFKVDLAAGTDTQIGDAYHHEFESFTIIGDKAYAADALDMHLYQIDLTTNIPTPIGAYGSKDYVITDLTSEKDGTLLGVRMKQDDVAQLDPETGIPLGVVATGLPDFVTSLAYGSHNNLWFIPAFDTTLYSLNLGTGQITPVLEGLDVIHVSGLTARVPSPGAGAILAIAGLAGLSRRRASGSNQKECA